MELTFRLSGAKKDEKKIKGVIGKWSSEKGHFGNLTLADRDITLRPNTGLSLQVRLIDYGQKRNVFRTVWAYSSDSREI